MGKLNRLYTKALANKYLAMALTGAICLSSSVCCVRAAFKSDIDDKAVPPTIAKHEDSSPYDDLFNFVFYSALYREFPETMNIKQEDLQEYLDNRMIENLSMAEYVKQKTDEYIEAVYNYNIVYKSSKLNLTQDIDAVITTIKASILKAAQEKGISAEEYLKVYYRYTGAASFDDIIYIISVYTAYKDVYLLKSSQEITESISDKYYEKYKNYLDSYTFAYFEYKVNPDEEISDNDLKKRQSKLNNMYENSHSLDDFESLASSFLETYPEGKFLKKKTYTYEQLYKKNENILDYLIEASPEKDELCYVNKDDTIYMIYFISRQKNSTACYEGYYIKGNNADVTKQLYNDMKETGIGISDIDAKYITEFRNTSVQEIGLSQEQYDFFKDSATPFYIYDNDYQRIVYITGTSGTWYQKVIRTLYYEDLCEETESIYTPLAQIYMCKKDFPPFQ